MGMTIYHMDDGTLLLAEDVPVKNWDPVRVEIGRAAVIRWWGTTKGRGQLAIEGPTDKTTPDIEPAGGFICWLHVRRSIRVAEAAEAAWRKRLKWY